MDGPNVNLKFLRELKEDLKAQDPENKKFLEIGSCGLHVMNNAFTGGIKAAN